MSSILNRFTEPTDTRDLTNQLNRLVSQLNEQFANVATQQNATAAAVAAKSKTTPTASLGPGTPTPQGSLEDPINLTATVTHKQDLLLQWAYPTTLPRDFAHFQVRVGTSWDAGTLVHDTKHTELLITDPTPGTNLYWVGIYNRAGSTDDDPPSVSATLPALPDVTGFSAVVTAHNDILLAWTKISPLPHGFDAYELRSGASWAAGTLVDRTKKASYLITDPPNGSTTYWVGVLDKAGNYDPTPPSASISFTQQPYTVLNLLAADVGPFSVPTAIIGPFNFIVPPSGGRIHVDWTMLLTNGATAQTLEGLVQDLTSPGVCAAHRTHIGASAVHGFNASGHFTRLYPGGSTISIQLVCSPGSNPVTVNAAGALPGTVTFLDIQFHPTPN